MKYSQFLFYAVITLSLILNNVYLLKELNGFLSQIMMTTTFLLLLTFTYIGFKEAGIITDIKQSFNTKKVYIQSKGGDTNGRQN